MIKFGNGLDGWRWGCFLKQSTVPTAIRLRIFFTLWDHISRVSMSQWVPTKGLVAATEGYIRNTQASWAFCITTSFLLILAGAFLNIQSANYKLLADLFDMKYTPNNDKQIWRKWSHSSIYSKYIFPEIHNTRKITSRRKVNPMTSFLQLFLNSWLFATPCLCCICFTSETLCYSLLQIWTLSQHKVQSLTLLSHTTHKGCDNGNL